MRFKYVYYIYVLKPLKPLFFAVNTLYFYKFYINCILIHFVFILFIKFFLLITPILINNLILYHF